MQNDALRLMARELSKMVKKLPRLDWTERESVRAGLRCSARRLLAKYGYPPDLAEDTTQLVLRQAELSTDIRYSEQDPTLWSDEDWPGSRWIFATRAWRRVWHRRLTSSMW